MKQPEPASGMQTSWSVGHPQLPTCYREIAELAIAAAGRFEKQRERERERERERKREREGERGSRELLVSLGWVVGAICGSSGS